MRTRLGPPKYRWTGTGLFVLGLGLGVLYDPLGQAEWISSLAGVVLTASMCVFLAGLTAERRASERKHPKTHDNYQNLCRQQPLPSSCD